MDEFWPARRQKDESNDILARMEERLQKNRNHRIALERKQKSLKLRRKKQLELNKKKQYEGKYLKTAKDLLKKYSGTIHKFLEIAERKVSVIDDYGDECWEELPREINNCLKKIAFKEKVRFCIEDGNFCWSSKRFPFLEKELALLFRSYHKKQAKNFSGKNSVNVGIMTGVEFETHIAKVLREKGYDVVGTPATGDQGADLIAKINGKIIVIQAKRYLGTVGNKAVQEVVGALNYYGGTEGWVITNSLFTPSAKALAQKNSIKLIDGITLKNSVF